ncbi:molybdopterin molybdotransferase MoeA [Anaeromyxobacter paludicola]|uniref:Molybdopterin molybdenumtransferase n=1 Tax=Anaeromyxobacter paludicola TaxID=2918171 RepID=A0ABM7X5X2_9BACT|nr:gephyrin-like molybdotransferase Glp [Anaeromyxobacter paludicola]BDG07206.1 molybdopterin molybdenumtransferase MoeA [Anaeromyxobacter paludicola]
MLTPDAALRRILDALRPRAPLQGERVPLAEARGRALAEAVVAGRPSPPFDNASMDGYALRAADAPAPGAGLPVAFDVFAGAPADRPLPPGACCRIFTGAAIPPGADAVEMQEEVERRGRRAIFRRAAVKGRFVRAAGAELREGAVALPRGAVVDAGAVGLLAALGRTEVAVHRRPRVAILATGSELVPVDGALRPGQIRDSNSHALAAACREAGAEPTLLPIAGDEAEALDRALAGAALADVLLTSGGVSVGERDLVRPALERAGFSLDFWRVAMRPGKPVAFGASPRAAVFGLPGNPASALVTFELFVRPALRALAGLPGNGRAVLPARLAVPWAKPAGLTVFLRARARVEAGALWVEPLATQESGHLTSVTGHQALAVLPAGAERLRRGARVSAILVAPPTLDPAAPSDLA